MLVRYKFVNETVEIEVSEEWGAVLAGQDRLEYNNEQKETRRHVSLDTKSEAGEWLAIPDNVNCSHDGAGEIAWLTSALEQLPPKQRLVVFALYVKENPLSQAELATRLGTTEEAIKQRAKRAKRALVKILKKSDTSPLSRDLQVKG